MNTDLRTFIGTPVRIDDEGQYSAIWKQPVEGPVRVTREGLVGDEQADRRVHGGPEKAIHHYAAENYARLAARFPRIGSMFTVGSIGENISTTGHDEADVCIGDIFRLGTAVVQVSQPRSPCWKIDHRYGISGITAFIVDSGLTGWYYRVLEEGEVAPGDSCERIERLPGAVTLAHLWSAWHQHRPDAAAHATLVALIGAPGLTPGWTKKIRDRLAWLEANGYTRPTQES